MSQNDTINKENDKITNEDSMNRYERIISY